MSDKSRNLAPLNNGDIPLSTMVRVMADEVEEVSNATELQRRAPTDGRVAEGTAGDLADGERVYLGDGTQWLLVDDESGLTTPAISTASGVTVSGMWGDTGDWIPMWSRRVLQSNSTSTTSAQQLTGTPDTGAIFTGEITRITGIDAFAVSLSAEGKIDTGGETFSASIHNGTGVEIPGTDITFTETGYARKTSGISDPVSGVVLPWVYGSVTGGVGQLQGATVVGWGRVE